MRPTLARPLQRHTRPRHKLSLHVSACRFGAAHVSATPFSATDLYQFFLLLGYAFFYSKDGDQYYIQIVMKCSAVFIIINIHKLDFVLLLLPGWGHVYDPAYYEV